MTWADYLKASNKRNEENRQISIAVCREFDVEACAGGFCGPRFAEAEAAYAARKLAPISMNPCGACGAYVPADRSCDCFDNGCQ